MLLKVLSSERFWNCNQFYKRQFCKQQAGSYYIKDKGAQNKKKLIMKLLYLIFFSVITFNSLESHASINEIFSLNRKKTSTKKLSSDFTHRNIDFCSNTRAFDFRNAYWLGVLADHAYLDPREVFPIISAISKAITFEVPLLRRPEYSNENRLFGLTFGKGVTTVKYYSSAKQKLGEGTANNENHYTRWVTPLPAEACIRPECRECFLTAPLSLNNKEDLLKCQKRCGIKNESAYFDKSVLLGIINKTKASLNLSSEEIKVKNQIDKYIAKFNSMKKFEGKSLEINGVSIWKDPKTPERCEQHTLNRSVIADTQAYIVENEEAIYILFRGTEYNAADIRLNLESLDLRMFDNENGMKGGVHNGFYIAHFALKNFIKESLEESLAKSPNKPIFYTGHSLGGAIGHIALYSLLVDKKVGFKANIKAIYTYGSPRVGNREFATDYSKKAKEFGIGIYNLSNEDDIVSHVPCTGYNHTGAKIFLSSEGQKFTTKAVYNPSKLSSSRFFLEPNSCGYISAIKNIFSINDVFREHKMTTYLERLSDLRGQLGELKLMCANDNQKNDLDKIKLPENIKINFQSLDAGVENL